MATMIHNWTRGPAAVLGLAAFLAMSGGQAEAALTLNACPASFTQDTTAKVWNNDVTAGNPGGAKLTAGSQCQYLTPPDQSFVANVDNINTAGFFGTTSWEAVSLALTQVDVEASSGTWSIPGADFVNLDYAIMFKDGEGTNLVGILLNELFASGGWDTPFTEPPFTLAGGSTSHDVSHFTIVQRDGNGGGGGEDPPDDVPEPGVLGLMGLGLLGLGLTAYARRRRVA